MRHRVVVAIFVFFSSLCVINAQHPGGSAAGKKLKNPVASNVASIEAGSKTYQKMCAFCHGKDAAGNGPMAPKGMTPPPSLIDAKWDRGSTDGEIFAESFAFRFNPRVKRSLRFFEENDVLQSRARRRFRG